MGRLDRRQVVALLLVGLVAGAAGAGLVVAVSSFLSNSVHVQNGVTLHAPTGPAVTIEETAEVNLTDPFPASDTVEIRSSKGNITATGSQWANVTVDQINGTWTNTSSIDVIGKTLTLNPGDKSAATVTGDITSLDWKASMAADDGTTDFVYSSALGSGSVTLRGLPGNTKLGAVDPSSHTLLDVATTDGSGSATFSGLSSGSHSVEFVTTKGAPTFSGASPTGNANSNPTQLSVNVSDPDFPAGDQVDLTFKLDGVTVGTDTLTANGTATTSISSPTGGTHSWTVTATDGYSQTRTASYSLNIPSTLSIFNESAPDTLITSPTNVTVQFFANENIIKRTTTTGSVNLTGLPVNQPIYVKADADGYYSRTVYIPSLYQQQEVYLLNENVTVTTDRFTLADTPGFPQGSSTLYIKRAITKNGSTTWKTIVSDQFGVAGLTTTLEKNVRYRVVIENIDTNKVAVLGAYTATIDETVELHPEPPGVGVTDDETGVGYSVVQTDSALTIQYSDPTNTTDSLDIWIHERGNTSQKLVANQTYFGLGEVNEIEPLSGADANTSWVVVMTVARGNETFVIRQNAGNRPGTLVPADLDPMWLQFIAVALLVLFAGIFSIHTRGVGAFAVAAIGAVLWWVGWLGVMASGAAVAMALGIGIMVMLTDSPGPGLG